MKKMLVLTVLVLICVMLFAGCLIRTGNDDGKTAVPMKNAGGVDTIPDVVNVTKGTNFEFSLEGNPTTGYTWQVYVDDEEILEYLGEDYVVDDPNADGSGGVSTLKFKALEKGETKVTLEYAQDWEGGDLGEEKEITVVVE